MPEVGFHSFLSEGQVSWLSPSLTDSPNLSLVQFQPGPRYHWVSREWFFFRAAMNSVIVSSGNKLAEKVRAMRWGRAWLWVTRTTDSWALLCSPLWWLEPTEDERQKYSYFGLKQVSKLVNLSGLCREVYFRVWFEYALSQVHLSGSGMSLWVWHISLVR